MTDTIDIRRPRGKPLGYRAKEGLHDQILSLLAQDKVSKGDGMTAFAISKALATPDPTIRLYLEDLVKERKISSRKIAGMVLYRLPRTQK